MIYAHQQEPLWSIWEVSTPLTRTLASGVQCQAARFELPHLKSLELYIDLVLVLALQGQKPVLLDESVQLLSR